MNITISPTVQETGNTGAGAALMAPKPFSSLGIKSPTVGGGARRALTALGTNNAKLNLSMAHSNLEMAQEEFVDIWNFNPLKEVPLTPGRYEWAPLSRWSDLEINSVSSTGVVEKDITMLKDITNPIVASAPPSVTSENTDLFKSKKDDLENNKTVPLSYTYNYEESDSDDNSDSENRKQVASPSCEISTVSTKSILSKSQLCITEFFRPQKRKSKYHCDASQPNTHPKKKLRTVH